ncbi:DUF2442 domain-containing protein [Thalassobaculum sp.]|uniref:DUF2442 domain-containing protein n=1 Tax=Thalassobaculum sp. TaxID=2022740 RepID=UPI0032EC10AB
MSEAMRTGPFEFVQSVEYRGPEYLLAVTWRNGRTEEVDLAPLVFRYRILRPLRDLGKFRQVSVDEYGNGLSWGDDPDLEVSPEQLRELIEAQCGPRLRTSYFRHWMARRNLRQEDVAGLLNVSKRTVAGYATGSAAIDTPTSLAIGLIVGYTKPVNDPGVLAERVREIERCVG